jgi:thiosulfate dehydrogenase [quinone] large subunit
LNLREHFQQRTYLVFLAIARISIGYHFTVAGWAKVSRGFNAENLLRFIGNPENDPFPWHRAFIEGFVVPNAGWFSQLVAYGELAIGLSLLTGCLVRVASAFGALENLNIYLAVADSTPDYALHRIYVILHVAFVLAAAGRVLGLDYWLHRRFPRSKLF